MPWINNTQARIRPAFRRNNNLIDMNLEMGTFSWGGGSAATPTGTFEFQFRPSEGGQHVEFVFPTGATSSYVSLAVPLLTSGEGPWVGTVFLDNITIQ